MNTKTQTAPHTGGENIRLRFDARLTEDEAKLINRKAKLLKMTRKELMIKAIESLDTQKLLNRLETLGTSVPNSESLGQN